MKSARRAAIVLVYLLLALVPTHAQQFQIKTHTLKNGMKIIVEEDHSIPVVALYLFYRIGSRNERPGTTGLSHFFEHMMFNGAKKYGPKQFDRMLEAAGGSNNAYTGRDLTVYQDYFPNSALDLIFDLEADRLANLSFDLDMIKSERDVVAAERRSNVENHNFGRLSEQLWATAYIAHPYQWPILGWMADIENWKIEDLKRHFELGYSPSNATMVMSGDVTAEEVFSLAGKYFDPIASRVPPAPVTTREPEQTGERRVIVQKFAQLPLLIMGYHVPQTASPDFYPLQVLQTILLHGESSRLYQRIVDKDQLALSVRGGMSFSIDPTLFTIVTQPKADVQPEIVERAIYDELDKIKAQSVSDWELEKAKNILLANFYRQIKTIDGKAETIGNYELFFGDYRKLFTVAEEYNQVTKEDVKRVVQKYFGDKNRTVAALVPEEQEDKKRASDIQKQ
jgi:zinc protease